MTTISSPHNERVKRVRLLQQATKARRRERQLVLEGVRLIADALDAGAAPEFALHTASAAAQWPDLLARLAATGRPLASVSDELMQAMADTETPQGVLAVFAWPELAAPPDPALLVVADGWRDPGNLGTLLRTAAAAGVSAVAVTSGTVDPYNPKALRGGMGAHFRVPILLANWRALREQFPALPVYLADAAGEARYDAVDWSRPALLAIGGEAHGLRDVLRDTPHTLIRIPMAPGAESLNAAVAASVLIYEARRRLLE